MAKYMMTDKENYDIQDNINVYNKFLDFKESFFDNGVSFFDRNINLFVDNEVFEEYERRVITKFDPSKRNHIEKYKKQLSGASKKVRHFFANIIWLYNYPIADKKTITKLSEIEIYLDEFFNKSDVENSLLNNGIASYGQLSQHIYYDINFIYFFTKQYIKNRTNPNGIINNINLRELMLDISDEKHDNMQALASKDILNYLFDPDYYEPIVNTSCKSKIVKSFLGKSKSSTLDDDIYKIRKDEFGFDKSIYSVICGKHKLEVTKKDKKVIKGVAQIIDNPNSHSYKDYPLTINSKNNNDSSREKSKLENGLKAEELVYESIIKKTKKEVLINKISEIYDIKEFNTLLHDIDKLIHYSKNYDKYAPFDLISTRDEDILYIEVKSTVGNEIFFSKSEIKFAYHNLDRYQVKVVKDSVIYDMDIYNKILDIYTEITKSDAQWSYETIKLKLEFL